MAEVDENNPALQRYYQLIDTTYKNDPNINVFKLAGFEMTDKLIDQFKDAVSKNYFIYKIQFCRNNLSTRSCMQIFDLLKSNPKIKNLEISENNVNDDAMSYLSTILVSLPSIREPMLLNFRKNDLTATGAQHLAYALERNAPVSWLDIRNNEKITDIGVEYIANSLIHNNILTALDLIKCGCSINGVIALARALSQNRTLKILLLQDQFEDPAIASLGKLLSDPECSLEELYLWRCNLSTPSLEKLCKALNINNSITTLGLSYNSFNDSTAFAISNMIYNNTTLKKLHLGANQFSPSSASFFAIALNWNKTLQVLDLSRNYLTSQGLWPITTALENNSKIQSLDIRANNIDSSGAVLISDLFDHNRTIHSIRLSLNEFGDAAIVLLSRTLSVNNTLKEIELDNVKMTAQGFAALCEALMQNTTLEKISVAQNNLGDEAMKHFKEVLKVNTTLQNFSLADCGIDEAGCACIAEGLGANSSLRFLNISKNKFGIEGLTKIADSLLSNFALLKVDYDCTSTIDDYALTVFNRISDSISRNDYFHKTSLIYDMGTLARDEEMYMIQN